MSIKINNTDISKVIYNGTELNKVIYNGVIVWQSTTDSNYVVVCTPVTVGNSATSTTHTLEFVVSTGDTAGSISITNDETFVPIEVAANSSNQVVDLSHCTVSEPIIRFQGGFNIVVPQEYEIGSMSSLKAVSAKINKVLTWPNNQTANWDGQFSGADFTQDLTIPSYFTSFSLSSMFRNDADLSKINLYFNNNCPTIYAFSNLSGDTNRANLMTPDRLPQNTITGTNCWAINNVAIMSNADGSQNNEIELISIPEGTTRLASNLISSNTYIKKILIPASVNQLDKASLNYSLGTDKIIQFNHSKNAYIDLPTTAGDGKGIAYDKSARSITIVTDNLIIKNYNWAGDNVTAKFKHIDGTDWKLATPIATLTDTIISWESVTGAAKYLIKYTPTTDGCVNNIETTATSYDVAIINLPAGTYSVQVTAIVSPTDDEHDNSDASTAVSYVVDTQEEVTNATN